MVWTAESRIRSFLWNTRWGPTGYTGFTTPDDAVDFLEFMKTEGINEVLVDPMSYPQTGFLGKAYRRSDRRDSERRITCSIGSLWRWAMNPHHN